MDLDKNFIQKAFHSLALSDFSELELKLVLYFFSKGTSCFDNLILKASELSRLMEEEEKLVTQALLYLQRKSLIRLKQRKPGEVSLRRDSVAISVNKEIDEWDIPQREEIKQEKPKNHNPHSFTLIKNQMTKEDEVYQATLITDFYMGLTGAAEKDRLALNQDSLKLIVQYSFDSVLFMIKHFYKEVSSFKDLLKNWGSYQEKLQKSLNQIDFLAAKKQHDQDDEELREIAKKWSFLASEKKLTSEEVKVLEIIAGNEHPRRQIFWAYRFRENYPNLKLFFEENLTRMLPVTTAGKVVKKK